MLSGDRHRLFSAFAACLICVAGACLAPASTAKIAADPSALGHMGRGAELMRDERFQEAAGEFEQAIQLDSFLSPAKLNLGICRFELRQYDKARTLFGDITDPKTYPQAWYYLGRLDLLDGNLDSAIHRFRSLLSGPRINDEQYYLAFAYFKKEQFPEVLSPLQRWIAINPRDFRAHLLLAKTLAKLKRPEEASLEFARTKKLHEYYNQGSITLKRCQGLLTAGREDEAWMECKPMLETDDPDKAESVAMLFAQGRDIHHAREAWQTALALEPESPEVNYNFALACFSSRDTAAARTYSELAVKLWPDFPEANVLYGTILYMLREDALARRVLEHALVLRPDDASVERLLQEMDHH